MTALSLCLILLFFLFVLLSNCFSNVKDPSSAQKLSRGGIPLANGDALLPKPPPWAYPLWTTQEAYRNSTDRMSSSTAQAIDQAMSHKSDAKMKIVSLKLSVEKQLQNESKNTEITDSVPGEIVSSQHGTTDVAHGSGAAPSSDLEWVRVVLTADPGTRMQDIEVPGAPRRREHRRVPSTVAIEEVKVRFCICK